MNQGIPAILLDVYASAGFQVVFEQFLTKASPGDRPGPCSTCGDSQAGGDSGDGTEPLSLSSGASSRLIRISYC